MAGRIVVGVDGSPASRAALRWAVDEARRRAATVEAVAAWHVPMANLTPSLGEFTAVQFEQSADKHLRQVLDEEGLLDATEPTVVEVTVEGAPALALCEAAEGADLLVVGSRGLGAFKGMVLGSVSLHCVSHAPCDVVVVRHPRHD